MESSDRAADLRNKCFVIVLAYNINLGCIVSCSAIKEDLTDIFQISTTLLFFPQDSSKAQSVSLSVISLNVQLLA